MYWKNNFYTISDTAEKIYKFDRKLVCCFTRQAKFLIFPSNRNKNRRPSTTEISKENKKKIRPLRTLSKTGDGKHDNKKQKTKEIRTFKNGKKDKAQQEQCMHCSLQSPNLRTPNPVFNLGFIPLSYFI
jgi:hypothetical protein